MMGQRGVNRTDFYSEL